MREFMANIETKVSAVTDRLDEHQQRFDAISKTQELTIQQTMISIQHKAE